MKRTLRLRRESLSELAAPELLQIRGGTSPWVTDGHHCQGSTLCAGVYTTYTSQCPITLPC